MIVNIESLIQLCHSASEAVMDIYEKGSAKVQNKKDLSPVTEADLISNKIIEEGLARLYPNIPIISEESASPDYSVRKNWEYCWIVDPLDGTREFIRKTGEFTINIALIKNQVPIAGFVHIPVKGITYYALKGKGAFKNSSLSSQRIYCTNYPTQKEVKKITVSRYHKDSKTAQFIDNINPKKCIEIGSSLKILIIAEGLADLYPRLAHLSEWDMAAGQIILEEAGGSLVSLYNKRPLKYNKKRLVLPYFWASSKKYPKLMGQNTE